jgi:putative transposase
MKKAMRRNGNPKAVVTDRLRSYRAAMKIIGNAGRQVTGRWLNNRAENSHQPFRRRERAMATFRSIKSLQKFASIHCSIHNHFNQERHLSSRESFKQNRANALTGWRRLAV